MTRGCPGCGRPKNLREAQRQTWRRKDRRRRLNPEQLVLDALETFAGRPVSTWRLQAEVRRVHPHLTEASLVRAIAKLANRGLIHRAPRRRP